MSASVILAVSCRLWWDTLINTYGALSASVILAVLQPLEVGLPSHLFLYGFLGNFPICLSYLVLQHGLFSIHVVINLLYTLTWKYLQRTIKFKL